MPTRRIYSSGKHGRSRAWCAFRHFIHTRAPATTSWRAHPAPGGSRRAGSELWLLLGRQQERLEAIVPAEERVLDLALGLNVPKLNR